MLEVIYYRVKANVNDLRYFKDQAELNNWLERQYAIEPIIILSKKELV